MDYKLYLKAALFLVGVSLSVCEEHVCNCQFNVNDIAMGKIHVLETKLQAMQGQLTTEMTQLIEQVQVAAEAQQDKLAQVLAVIGSSNSVTKAEMMKYFQDMSNTTWMALMAASELFQKQATDMTAAMEAQDKKVQDLMEKIKALEDKEDDDKGDEWEPEESDKPGVAFFAHTPLDSGTKFSHIITNIGHGYDENNGQFVCPIAGIYLFTFSVQTIRNKNAHCNIMKNKAIMTYAQTSDSYADMSSISAILSLAVDDIVELGNCANMYSAYSGEVTSFAGVLIQRQPVYM